MGCMRNILDMEHRRALVNSVINLCVPQQAGNFLTSSFIITYCIRVLTTLS